MYQRKHNYTVYTKYIMKLQKQNWTEITMQINFSWKTFLLLGHLNWSTQCWAMKIQKPNTPWKRHHKHLSLHNTYIMYCVLDRSLFFYSKQEDAWKRKFINPFTGMFWNHSLPKVNQLYSPDITDESVSISACQENYFSGTKPGILFIYVPIFLHVQTYYHMSPITKLAHASVATGQMKRCQLMGCRTDPSVTLPSVLPGSSLTAALGPANS